MSGSPAFTQSFGPRAILPGSVSGTIVSWSRSTAFSPKPVTTESAIALVAFVSVFDTHGPVEWGGHGPHEGTFV